MEKVYNKLVRDKIPSIIEKNGEVAITKVLSTLEYQKCLETKLREEMEEVLLATGKNRLEELADLLEIMIYLAKIEESTLEDILKIGEEKRKQKGAFEDRIFLVKTLKR